MSYKTTSPIVLPQANKFISSGFIDPPNNYSAYGSIYPSIFKLVLSKTFINPSKLVLIMVLYLLVFNPVMSYREIYSLCLTITSFKKSYCAIVLLISDKTIIFSSK